MTTMVLTYTAGSPPHWVARIDPLNTKGFQLSVMFDPLKAQVATTEPGTVNGVILKSPFSSPIVTVDNAGGMVTVSATNTNVSLSAGDVDVFEVLFKPTGSLRPGSPASAFLENFDGVVAPVLPAGWTAANASGPGPLWVTSSAGVPTPPADTAPNAAFVNDPAVVSDKRLDSPSIPITTGSAQLTFRNNYNLQGGAGNFLDGGVLEISIGGGAFTDILAAGGSFVTGGYNGPISGGSGNPLAGRMAWSGNSGGFITTTVNLPASAVGQNIVLRFRMGSDSSGSGVGWRIDNISIADSTTFVQPPFTVFANGVTGDFIDAIDPTNPGATIHFSANEIAPTTRTFVDNVFPHIWDPTGVYDDGRMGGAGTWDTSFNAWDDLPSAIPGPPPPFNDTPWNNATHAHDIAVFGGNPGTGIVTLAGPISVGGFQFDNSGYDIEGNTLTLSSAAATPSFIDTGANSATIGSTITGDGFTKIGAGTLTLTGANTYSGGTIVNNGTLLVKNASGSGTGSGSVVAVPGPAPTVAVIGGTGTIAGPVTINPNATLRGGTGTSANGTLTIANNLTLSSNSSIELAFGPGGTHSTLNRGAGTWTFAPNQSFTFINLGAQSGSYINIITGLASDPGVGSWQSNGLTGNFFYNAGNVSFIVGVVPASSNANLSDLAFSAGPISSAFHPGTTNYTLIVPFSTTSTTVTPTAADGGATITVNGNTVVSGTPSPAIPLNVGNNTITTVVTAADATTMKTYTVNLTRASPNSNADLSNLVLSAGAISPPFSPGITSYTLNVPSSTTSTTATPTAADAGAMITVNGISVPSGNPSGPIPLNIGTTPITVVVTATDTTTMKTYTVNVIREAQIAVSGSTGADGSYTTLQEAFAALNANANQGGNIISVLITGDTAETATAVLNQPSVSSWTNLIITPSGARTVNGAMAPGSPLIDLNGADNVTIDGLNVSGNSLTISNTTASVTPNTSTVRLINGATSNLLTNCRVLGSSISSTTTAGGNVLIGTSAGGTNSGNTISNNDLGPAGTNLPTKCVMSLGSASPNQNTNNVISNNNIHDYFSATASTAGISIQSNNFATTITNNRIYQTAARVFTTTALTYTGILVQPGSTGSATITGNVVGFGAANGTGTTTISGLGNRIAGINASSTSTTVATSIQNNTVSGFNQTTSNGGTTTTAGFTGISVGATAGLFNIGGTTGNTVGSLDGSSSIVVNNTTTTTNTWAVLGIFDFSFQSGDVISNNGVGTVTINSGGSGTGSGFRGIRLSGTGTQTGVVINNNTIGGTAAGSITDNVVGTYNMYGIEIVSATFSATGNLIRNMSGDAQAAGFIGLSGIIISTAPTGASTISQNTIHSLSDNAGAANSAIYALYGNFGTAANVVERNFVHSLSVTGTNLTTQMAGILGVAGTATYKNNMVRQGIDASGASITGGYTMYGMFDIAGTNNFYYNSVYIGGSGVASSSNTFAFVSNVTTNVRNYVDNILWNGRSNASGGGKNYAIAVAGTTPNPAGLTSNYNDLFANGTGGFTGLFNATDQLTLANWRTATAQDANSISVDPQFVNPTGTAATLNLHIACGSPARNSGIPIAGITTDFDNDTRNATTPAIGADEPILSSPTALSAVSRKVHGATGSFDVNLPLSGLAGIESRSGGGSNAYQIVFTFSSPVNVASAVVSAGTGMVSLVSGSGTNTITADLSGVTNAQYITITLKCVDDGLNIGDVSVTMGVLVGDRTANGSVAASDVSQVKSQVGNTISAGNFRSDMNVNGSINATDVTLTKVQSGTALP